MKINQQYEAKALDKIPVCPRESLVIISNTTGLSFALERIGPLVAIIITIFYLLVLYQKPIKNLFASIYSDSLIKTVCQHLLLLVGFDTLIYRNYYDTPPILVGHQGLGEGFVGEVLTPGSHYINPTIAPLGSFIPSLPLFSLT
jgi:hypothetical protein